MGDFRSFGGFLDPEAKWYPCPSFGHAEYAYELLDKLDPTGGLRRGAFYGLLGTDVLLKKGWLHISHGYVQGATFGLARPNEVQRQWLWDHVDRLDPDMVRHLEEGDD